MTSLFQTITPFLEITVITVMLYYLFSFFWNTRSMDLFLGLGAFLLIFGVSSLLQFQVLHKILLVIANVAVIAVLIIFQPELRVALSRLSLKSKRIKETEEVGAFLDSLINVVYSLAKKRIGALIVLENEQLLSDISERALVIDGKFSPELLMAIFDPSSPIHDGAVIIRDLSKILCAGAILDLAEGDTKQLTPTMGTRHRAGLGMAQKSDALVIIVSEESGLVSVAHRGSQGAYLASRLERDRLKGILRSLFCPQKEKEDSSDASPTFKSRWTRFKGWLKK